MPRLLDLYMGAERVLPTTVQKFERGEVILQSIRVSRFHSAKMMVASGPVLSSKQGAYVCQVALYGTDANNPSVMDRCGVRCECQAYRFWFSEANRRAGAAHGARFAPYRRKTPIDDPRYPPRNPQQIPGACKHILSFLEGMMYSGLFKEKPKR